MATDNPASRKQSAPPLSLLDVSRHHRAPMTREDTEAFVRMSLADREAAEMPIQRALTGLPEKPPAQIAIIVDRIRIGADVPVRLPTLILVSCFCSTLARCVLWAYTIVVLTRTLGRAVTVSDLADAFPWGFPTDEGYGLIWDAQKDARGNRLDFHEIWQLPAMEGAA